MKTRDVNILFWDNSQNFNREDTQDNLGIFDKNSTFYKKVFQFYDENEFNKVLDGLEDDEYVYIICHIDIGKNFRGYKKFQSLLSQYPNLINNVKYVSSSPEAHKQFFEKQGVKESILTYLDAKNEIGIMPKIPTKKELLNINDNKRTVGSISFNDNNHFDYAIITALYEYEFEEVQKLFESKPVELRTGTQIYYSGAIAGKKVIATYASKTGMVEAAVIVSSMIHLFTPKYVLMPGVCGGSSDTDFGNIIVAKNVFPLQNGKVSDLKEKIGDTFRKVKIKYGNRNFDETKLTDSAGHQIKLIVEKNERENEGIDIDTELSQMIEPKLKDLEYKIQNDPYKKSVKIHFEAMACSMMVVNKEDYFEEQILGINRKTKAVEMESYGVARACKIANGGNTKWLIFKSVMDKTKGKNDDYKAMAANSSALFLKYLLEMNII